MNRTELIARLRAINACTPALTWIEQTPGEPADLWAACPRGDWMIWLLAEVAYNERVMRHIACDCAEDVLSIYELAHPDDRRPRDAIAVARRYADGEATEEERAAVWAAVWDAVWDAAGAAARNAARAAAAAAAGDAAKAAAADAVLAAALDAAMDAALDAAMAAVKARHADMIRARVSWADVERVMERTARAAEGQGEAPAATAPEGGDAYRPVDYRCRICAAPMDGEAADPCTTHDPEQYGDHCTMHCREAGR